MKSPKFPAYLQCAALALVIFGLTMLSAAPASAVTFGFTIYVDCYDSDVDNTGTDDTVYVEAWGNGELILRMSGQPDCGALNDWGIQFSGLSAAQVDTIDQIRYVATGGDAFWMDEIYIEDWVETVSVGEIFNSSEWPDLKDTCSSDSGGASNDCHWGRDGGLGWCISTDSDDGHGAMWDYIDHTAGCQSCFEFKFNGSAYTCS